MLENRLEQLRTEKGMTKKEVADYLQIDQSTYGKYELGKRQPDYKTLDKLAYLYNVSVDYLLGRTNIRNESASIEKVRSAVSDDPELLQFWEELIQRDDLKMLMRQVRDLPPDGIKRIIRYIKMVEDEEAAEEI